MRLIRANHTRISGQNLAATGQHAPDARDQLPRISQVVRVEFHDVGIIRLESRSTSHVPAPLLRAAVVIALILEDDLLPSKEEVGPHVLPRLGIDEGVIDLRDGEPAEGQDDAKLGFGW